MSDVNKVAESIIDFINGETLGMDYNERAMVLLFVCKLCECAIELDMVDTLRPRKEGA